MTEKLCECGCGRTPSPGRRFMRGHTRYTPKPPMPEEPQLCACGCGQPTPLAKRTNAPRGRFKGRPLKFIPGHYPKGADKGNYNATGLMFKNGRYYVRRSDGSWERRNRAVMAEKLGRPLLPHEIVHHVDEDKTNDDPDNLELCAGNPEHYRRHHKVWDRDETVAALRETITILGHVPTSGEYREGHYTPSQEVIYRLFGSWERALRAAGKLRGYRPKTSNQFVRQRKR